MNHTTTRKAAARVILFTLTFVYWELALHMRIFDTAEGLLFPLLIAAITGLFCGILTTVIQKIPSIVITWLILFIRFILLMVYLIYWKVFKTAFSFALVIGGTEGLNAMTQFSAIVIRSIIASIPDILLFMVPLLVFLIFTIRHHHFLRPGIAFTGKSVIALAALCVIFAVTLNFSDDSRYGAKNLFADQWVKDLSLRKLGFDHTVFADLAYTIFPDTKPVSYEIDANMPETTTDTDEAAADTNTLDIDFASLAAMEEEGSDYEWLDNYMALEEPTEKNEYTGMFEGYNLIVITAESFSPWAVDEELTPTLYKLTHTGFVMNNFYVPAFNNTSDGEYMMCTGLIPNGMGNHSFPDTKDNDMALCFGNILNPLGYSTNAYHDNTYTFYERDKTHPNMGYTYEGVGNGLEITDVWPESDLEMMQQTMDDYINNDHFHAYYMTVSGHMEYDFTNDQMAINHEDEVASLDYDESIKAYIAANIELDEALEYMLERLEEAGKLDNTLIALAPDHYPYALESELTDVIGKEEASWYGLYKSSMILWSGSMTESVEIDKVCSSIDIAPTICNLLGLDYDSRLYSGNDILSDSPGLVIFSDMSFVTDDVLYNAQTSSYKMLSDASLPDDYIDQMIEVTNARWNAAGKILTTDYYRHLKELTGLSSLVTGTVY